MSLETYLTAFTESIQAMTERFILISQFDKTIEATIIEKREQNTYYVISQGGVLFTVTCLANDIYSPGDEVYINLSNGDYNSPDKFIIGKVGKISPKIAIFKKENYILEDYNSTILDQDNQKGYLIVIIEFDAYIQTNSQEARSAEELFVNFDISGKASNSNETIHKLGYWSTKNLYGNIFDNIFVNKLRIVIRNLEYLSNFEIKWNGDNINSLSLPIQIFDLDGNSIDNGLLKINNIKYYIGYDIDKIELNLLKNVSILLTYDGYKLFYKKKDTWSQITLDELSNLEPSYEWGILWYTWNPLQENYNSFNNPIPQYWDLLDEEPSTYNNKLVLLYCNDIKLSIYSILG